MKIYSAPWNWVDLNPNKRVNVTLPNGEIYKTVMPVVPHIPAVQQAWETTIRALIGSILASWLRGRATRPSGSSDISRRRGVRSFRNAASAAPCWSIAPCRFSEIAQHNAGKIRGGRAEFFPAARRSAVLKLLSRDTERRAASTIPIRLPASPIRTASSSPIPC